ncbi:disease resistance protein Roq1-like [Lycium ferocissimum]|uniref:disease resistance protein Roq1-like n=1 Tax=Lycium ferocissimum TaxID=112874 RepID=UPI002815680F|nr:disease resistance protein Roq1-like [Lycium ferocissimum]
MAVCIQKSFISPTSSSNSFPAIRSHLKRCEIARHCGKTYDAFLNFEVEDNSKSFTSHLYEAFERSGLKTFKDDVSLIAGTEISAELLEAIEESRTAIPIFSRDYASSPWCLDNLVKIMECNKKYGQSVLPVFYDVDPSDVRHQRNSFADSFDKLNEKYKDQPERVKRWKQALTEAANLSGIDVRNTFNGNEAKVIQEIVKVVEREVTVIRSTEIKQIRGVEFHMKKLNGSLRLGSDDNVRVIGMWGAPGTGKTAIAKAIFDTFSHRFEGAVFLPNVGEVTAEHGLVYLQNDLLKETFNYHVQAKDVFEGINLIREKLQSKKVLIVLDGVDHVKQIRALAGDRDWFDKGSRILSQRGTRMCCYSKKWMQVTRSNYQWKMKPYSS